MAGDWVFSGILDGASYCTTGTIALVVARAGDEVCTGWTTGELATTAGAEEGCEMGCGGDVGC